MLVAEQHLDRADIGSGFEQMGGKAVGYGRSRGLPSFAILQAFRHTTWSVRAASGCFPLRSGNSQCFGRASCQ
jgi:hypothetical protein